MAGDEQNEHNEHSLVKAGSQEPIPELDPLPDNRSDSGCAPRSEIYEDAVQELPAASKNGDTRDDNEEDDDVKNARGDQGYAENNETGERSPESESESQSNDDEEEKEDENGRNQHDDVKVYQNEDDQSENPVALRSDASNNPTEPAISNLPTSKGRSSSSLSSQGASNKENEDDQQQQQQGEDEGQGSQDVLPSIEKGFPVYVAGTSEDNQSSIDSQQSDSPLFVPTSPSYHPEPTRLPTPVKAGNDSEEDQPALPDQDSGAETASTIMQTKVENDSENDQGPWTDKTPSPVVCHMIKAVYKMLSNMIKVVNKFHMVYQMFKAHSLYKMIKLVSKTV
ncbi:hypothetical protein BDV18DRAFT_156672 [Aspergillus unguis]